MEKHDAQIYIITVLVLVVLLLLLQFGVTFTTETHSSEKAEESCTNLKIVTDITSCFGEFEILRAVYAKYGKYPVEACCYLFIIQG